VRRRSGLARRGGLAGLALAALAAGAPAARADDAPPPPLPRVVVVTGEGSARTRPDSAEIGAGVVSTAPSAQAALAANSKAMRALLDALKKAGVSDGDVQTTELRVSPQWRQPSSRSQTGMAPEIVGYEVTNGVRVVVDDLDSLGALLDAALRAGANRLDGVRFSASDPSVPSDRARRAAMADARRRAALYADEAGARLGAVLRVEEAEAPGFEPRAARMILAEAQAVPTAPGVLDFRATVRVTFALEPR
jgi:uncharacterized protein